jgi:eukaryotic-like serine/threonine-protein kinase
MKLCPVCGRTWEDDFRVCPIDGLVLPPPSADSDPYTGQTVGNAHVGKKIADGERGPVYLADSPNLGPVAVQFISPDKLSSPALAEAFQGAVNAAVKLNHPNVIRVHSLERSMDGRVAVVMEYVAGSNLEEYHGANRPFDTQQALRIVKEAAEGVLAAHRVSILHGALQPSRIMISSDVTAKVGGFHRASLRDEVLLSSTAPPGFAYLAPEKLGILRDFALPDYRADIYSLGVILYELLTGKLPYEVNTIEELSTAMEAGPPPPPNFANAQVSPTVSRVVLKAIARRPGDRHASVADFIRELEAARRPVLEPERDSIVERFAPPEPKIKSDESGLFGPTPTPAKRKDESALSWFRTRAKGRGRSEDTDRDRTGMDESNVPRKGSSRLGDYSEERTVVVRNRGDRAGQRKFRDTFFKREPDFTATGALPSRRFTDKAYLIMGLVGIVLVAGIVAAIWFFYSSPARLTIETNPPGAQVYLNDEFRGNTPLLISDLKADVYRLRLQMDGYEPLAENVEVGSGADVKKAYSLNKLAIVIPPLPPETTTPQPQPPSDNSPNPVVPASPPSVVPTRKTSQYEGQFNDAVHSRNLFPPASGNAWDVLQAWKAQSPAPTPALEQAQQSFCREVETMGGERLDQRDFQYVRDLLAQVRTRMPGQGCAGGLQSRYDDALSRSIADLRSSLNAALTRQNYVTPDSDNALKYVRLILQIDPQDPEAKTLDKDIYNRAMNQARAKSEARDHQGAINIYTQLRDDYPNSAGGQDNLNQAIEREKQKLALLSALKVAYSVRVKHGHSFLRVKNRECNGTLRVDGFTIEYQTSGEHAFKISYDLLKSVSFDKGKITLEGSSIPNGKIELEQEDKNPNPTLADVYSKIVEDRKLREQYFHPKPAAAGP